MISIQVYTCPTHGAQLVTCNGDAPDDICCGMECEGDAGPASCIERAVWTPSAPAVHTHDTSLRALVGHTRDTNPW